MPEGKGGRRRTADELAGLEPSALPSSLPPEQRSMGDLHSLVAPLSPQMGDLVEGLRSDPRALLGDRFVSELREAVKTALTKRKSWWESSLLVALVPTLGGVAIATIWQAYSRHTDQMIAE